MKTKKKRRPAVWKKFNEVKRSPFGKRLFDLRRAKGISQKTLGDQVGISVRMVSYYESDTQGPPVELLLKIAQVLNVKPSLLTGEKGIDVEADKISPSLKKTIDDLKTLPPQDQKAAKRMIAAMARRSKKSHD